MGNYSKDRLALIAQGIAGNQKIWFYNDTGAIGTVDENAAGFIQNANDMGVDTGDLVFVKATNGGTNNAVHAAAFLSVTDTGAATTQGTIGAVGVTGDTS
jgi:hypothetical protein